jgi:hypothetical protein
LRPSDWIFARRDRVGDRARAFSPLFVHALRARRPTLRPLTAASLAVIWLVSVWLIASGDPIRDSILGFALRENTSYASGFSDTAFRSVTPGMSEPELRSLLGAPHGEDWYYPPRAQPTLRAEEVSVASISRECVGLRFEYGFVVNAFDEDSCGDLRLWIDISRRRPATPRASARSLLELQLESHRSLSPPANGLLPELACGHHFEPVGEGLAR